MSATCLWSAGGGLPQSSRWRPLPLPSHWLAERHSSRAASFLPEAGALALANTGRLSRVPNSPVWLANIASARLHAFL